MKMESACKVLNVPMSGIQNEVAEEEGLVVLDSNGTRLADDTVTVIKDLKVGQRQKILNKVHVLKIFVWLKVTTTLIVRLFVWC